MSNLSLNSAILYLFHWLARTASRCRRDYILPLLFFSFLSFFLSFFFLSFFRRLISEVIERISTKLGHIFTCDCYLKNIGPNSTGHLPPQAGRKKCFFGTDFEILPNISLQRNMISTIGKKLVNLQELPYMPPWSKNGWERLASFCPSPKFSHCETLLASPHGRYITDSWQT